MVSAISSSQPTSQASIGKTALKVIGGVLLFAGATAGTGRLLQHGGTQLLPHLPAAGKAVTVTGNALFLTGKGAFLSVAVPVYTITWIIPRWIVTVGIPQAAMLVNKYVLIPTYQGLVKLSSSLNDALLRAAKNIYSLALEPIGRTLFVSMKWVWKAVILPVSDQIAQAVSMIYRHIVSPLARQTASAARWVWNSVVTPVMDAMIHRILVPLSRLLITSVKWVWSAAIVPVANAARKAVREIVQRVLQPLGRLLSNSVNWVWKVVITPCANAIEKAALAISRSILAPIGRAVAEASKWVWNAALVPMIKGVVQAGSAIKALIEKILSAVCQTVIFPAGKIFVDGTNQTIEAIRDVFQWLANRGSMKHLSTVLASGGSL